MNDRSSITNQAPWSTSFRRLKARRLLTIPEIPVIDDDGDRNVVIGIAEPANIPGVGAFASAVFNACGLRIRDLPITPDKIMNALTKKT